MKKNIIGIIGGMGPMATADLFKKIILNTKANSDQEHAHVIIDSNVMIPDRTDAILNNGENPVPELTKTAINLINAGANILIMPCNTAHYFYNEIIERINKENYVFLNMIEETAKYLKKQNVKNVCLLATAGTYKSQVYQNVFNSYNIELSVPSKENQNMIMESIYNYKKGIKKYHKEEFLKIVEKSDNLNNKKFILGCTELPL
ncbi:amino acid racemase, partial [Clostridiaceae bacterium HSG29]|nr:amino acid racemase [Clostridiaceae bacterium HSG29]